MIKILRPYYRIRWVGAPPSRKRRRKWERQMFRQWNINRRILRATYGGNGIMQQLENAGPVDPSMFKPDGKIDLNQVFKKLYAIKKARAMP